MQRRQAGGGIATSLATAGFQTIAQTGAAFATGGNGWGTLGMGVIQGAGAFAGSFLGGLDYGLGKIGNAITGVAAQQTVNYGMSGFQMDPNNGNISYKGPSRGAGMSALVQGAFGMLGAGMNAGYGIRGTPASTVSTTFNAVGAGIQFNDDGSLQKNYNWAKAGTSFAANMASTVASGYAGNFAKSDLVGTQVGRLANTITEAALGNQGAWNAYQPQGIFNTLGTYAGGELAKAVNNRNTAPDKVPVDQQPFRELLGGGAIIATRRREDNQDEDVLGGILEGFKSIGKAGYDAGAATAGAFSAAANWTTQNILNPIGNALSSAWNGTKNFIAGVGTVIKEQVGQRIANLIEHGSLRNTAELSKYTVDSAMALSDANAAFEALIAAKEKGIIGEKEMAEARGTLYARQSAAMDGNQSTALDMGLLMQGKGGQGVAEFFNGSSCGNAGRRIQSAERAAGNPEPQDIGAFDTEDGKLAELGVSSTNKIKSYKDNGDSELVTDARRGFSVRKNAPEVILELEIDGDTRKPLSGKQLSRWGDQKGRENPHQGSDSAHKLDRTTGRLVPSLENALEAHAVYNESQGRGLEVWAYHGVVQSGKLKGARIYSVYSHLKETWVPFGTSEQGIPLQKGQSLGVTGNTGPRSTGPHLHWGVYYEYGEGKKRWGSFTDPENFDWRQLK